jgi:hypothetical protein
MSGLKNAAKVDELTDKDIKAAVNAERSGEPSDWSQCKATKAAKEAKKGVVKLLN